MNSEIAARRSALLRSALIARFEQLCEVSPERLGRLAERQGLTFIADAVRDLRATERDRLAAPPVTGFNFRSRWFQGTRDCFSCLQDLARGDTVHLADVRCVTHSGIEGVKNVAPEERFRLLVTRYSCPFNLLLPSERSIREELLRQIMVPNRTDLEKNGLADRQHDDVLLKLNLIGVVSLLFDDLRFLDALNYWYERLPRDWEPRGLYSWLLISFLAIYGRAVLQATARLS